MKAIVADRLPFDGFSISLPAGWQLVDDDATYSDPDQPPRKRGRPRKNPLREATMQT